MYYDALCSSLGTILIQGKNVIAYALRLQKSYEKKYPTDDLELAVVVFSLKIPDSTFIG